MNNPTFSATSLNDAMIEIDGRKIPIPYEDLQLIAEHCKPPALDGMLTQEQFNEISQVAHDLVNPIQITLSEPDHIYAVIQNGSPGVIKKLTRKYKTGVDTKKPLENQYVEIPEDILRFHGRFETPVLIDEEKIGIKCTINGEAQTFSIEEAVVFFKKKHFLTPAKSQILLEILEAWCYGDRKSGKIRKVYSSPVCVIDGTIKVTTQPVDIKETLRKLRDFMPIASHPVAFGATFGWSITAPLHASLKAASAKGIQAPIAVLPGKTKAGKSALGSLFIGKGFDLKQDEFYYPYERIKSSFTLMKSLAASNIPALFDDLPPSWFLQHKEDLKAYVQTGHFGDRGRADLTIREFRGLRSFVATINDYLRIDDDLALSNRLLLLWFNEANTSRKNKELFDSLFDSVSPGFVMEIIRLAFDGQEITGILRDIEKFETPAEWVNYGINKINKLCQWYGIDTFPEYIPETESNPKSTNAYEIAEAFIAENDRIQKRNTMEYNHEAGILEKYAKYRSPLEGEFKVERMVIMGDTRDYIFFTGSAFKKLVEIAKLRVPYANALNFVNNIRSSDSGVRIEFQGNGYRKKIDGSTRFCYVVSIPVEVESP